MESVRQILETWGDFACFSRPELKVERFSYPVITPSAARGIFDAIYAKPVEFRWQIVRIEVLRRPAFLALRRNEVKEKVNVNAVLDWMNGKREPEPLFADGDRDLLGTDERGRTQRQTMALRDVRYRLHAEIRPWPGFESRQKALEAQFRRRAEKGKCFFQPYFGCREFPAFFRLAEPGPGAENAEPPVADLHLDVGLMLYDVFDLSRPGTAHDRPAVSLFRAAVRGGVLDVPDYTSPDVLKAPGGTSA
ncbi:MAG TPA: type I-C CRISPR-associated protein Cas5c [Thermoanaerobaculia bacterium]|nr:type I-C CRISPR-associated protein Cas5c [Thermoanaerobaculia bacterium]